MTLTSSATRAQRSEGVVRAAERSEGVVRAAARLGARGRAAACAGVALAASSTSSTNTNNNGVGYGHGHGYGRMRRRAPEDGRRDVCEGEGRRRARLARRAVQRSCLRFPARRHGERRARRRGRGSLFKPGGGGGGRGRRRGRAGRRRVRGRGCGGAETDTGVRRKGRRRAALNERPLDDEMAGAAGAGCGFGGSRRGGCSGAGVHVGQEVGA